MLKGGRKFLGVADGSGDPTEEGGAVWERERALVPSQALVLTIESVALE